MARSRRVFAASINIALHEPHSVERYNSLLLSAYKLRKIVKVRGIACAMMGSCYLIDKHAPERGIEGEIFKFINLDPNEPWFDLEKKEEADKLSRNQIFIPENLKPHLQRFPFVFFPEGHRFHFLTREGNRAFSAWAMGEYLDRLLNDPSLHKFSPVNITVEPAKETVSKIFEIHSLHRLEIELTRPNADDHNNEELRFLDKLAQQDAKRLEIKLVSDNGKSLKPDEETRAIARVAASNGHVTGTGYSSDRRKITISTQSHPLIGQDIYNPSTQSTVDALRSIATSLHTLILGRKRK